MFGRLRLFSIAQLKNARSLCLIRSVGGHPLLIHLYREIHYDHRSKSQYSCEIYLDNRSVLEIILRVLLTLSEQNFAHF